MVFEVTWTIWERSAGMKLSHYIIYITVEIVIYSSFNTSNSEPASFILNERETRFASGMERDRSNLSRSIRHQEIFEPQPGNFG